MLHDFLWIFLRLCEAAGREQSGAQAFTTFREETTQLSFQRNVFGEGVLLQVKAVWAHLGNITVIKMTREGCALLPATGDRRRGREKVRRLGKLEHEVLAAVAQHAGTVPPRPLRGELLVREPGLGLELCSSPSVPQPVVQSRRRPLLGPSPGWKRLLALSHLRHY